jgi:hypothetical protein
MRSQKIRPLWMGLSAPPTDLLGNEMEISYLKTQIRRFYGRQREEDPGLRPTRLTQGGHGSTLLFFQ